jgi:hypothetical protein
MEEEEVNEVAMKSRYPRRLNFNAPLLSTRRIGGYSGEEVNSQGVSQQAASDNSIPFSWEQAPGKPKESERGDIHDGDDTPRLRLPPCRWHPSIDATNNHDDHQAVINDHHDDSCDGDVDVDVDVDDDDDKDAAAFSDAMDVFSLSEAIDIVTKAEKVDEFNGLKLKLAESRGNESPNFIIKRFLPDATALAESSALNFSKSFSKKFPKPCNYPESSASPKGCGLEILFPWRMKHKLCGIKSPVRQDSLNLQPQWRTKQKKHYCSSANVFSNVDKDTRD